MMYRAGEFLFITVFVVLADVWQLKTPSLNLWNRYYESEHFVFWHNEFDSISDSVVKANIGELESILDFYVVEMKFASPFLHTFNKNKINCCIINDNLLFNNLNKKSYSEIILTHDNIGDKRTLARKLCHFLQARTGGFQSNPYSSWFLDSHADWISSHMYSNDDQLNEPCLQIPHLYFGNKLNCNLHFLEYLKQKKGIEFINNLWLYSARKDESEYGFDDVFSNIMRSADMDQIQFGDFFAEFALKNSLPKLNNNVLCKNKIQFSNNAILETVDSSLNRYIIPFDAAPQPFGYNIIRLYPDSKSESNVVAVKFRGIIQKQNNLKNFTKRHVSEPEQISDPGSDWRYGLIAVNNGLARYSTLMRASDGISDCSMILEPDDKELYLVVVATPSVYSRIFNGQSYRTIYRYPWMVQIDGALPDGYQKHEDSNGYKHCNGGGFVAYTAKVDLTVYIGPNARVLDNAVVKGSVRIEDYAVVKGDAVIFDSAVISNRAMVTGGMIYGSAEVSQCAKVSDGEIFGNAQVKGMAIIDNDSAKIYGKAIVGGTVWINGASDLYGNVQVAGDGRINSVSVSEGFFFGQDFSDVFDSSKSDRGGMQEEVTASGPFFWFDNESSVADSVSVNDYEKMLIRAHCISGTVTISVIGVNSENALIELMDIGGRVISNRIVKGDITFSVPAGVSQRVLLWRVSGNSMQKNGIVMSER